MSGGRHKIETLPAGALVPPLEVFDATSKNVLDDGFDASPALVDNEIYLRGLKHLYSIGETSQGLRP